MGSYKSYPVGGPLDTRTECVVAFVQFQLNATVPKCDGPQTVCGGIVPCVKPTMASCFKATRASVAKAALSYSSFADVLAVSDLEVLFESSKVNNDLLSRTSSIPIIQEFAVRVLCNPGNVPHVPGLNGDKKLLVTQACVTPPAVEEIVVPAIVMPVPATRTSCFAES